MEGGTVKKRGERRVGRFNSARTKTDIGADVEVVVTGAENVGEGGGLHTTTSLSRQEALEGALRVKRKLE